MTGLYTDSDAYKAKRKELLDLAENDVMATLKYLFGSVVINNLREHQVANIMDSLTVHADKVANRVEAIYVNQAARASEQASNNMVRAALAATGVDPGEPDPQECSDPTCPLFISSGERHPVSGEDGHPQQPIRCKHREREPS